MGRREAAAPVRVTVSREAVQSHRTSELGGVLVPSRVPPTRFAHREPGAGERGVSSPGPAAGFTSFLRPPTPSITKSYR